MVAWRRPALDLPIPSDNGQVPAFGSAAVSAAPVTGGTPALRCGGGTPQAFSEQSHGQAAGGRVLKELLPPLEERRLDACFFANGGNRHVVEQAPPQDGDLLLRGQMLALCRYVCCPLF